jgi:ribonuclease HI
VQARRPAGPRTPGGHAGAVTTEAYTDGACLGNPGPGGWAWIVDGGGFASGAEARSTNQRMEIAAALEAVRANPGPLVVVSDSTYVVNCFRDRWWQGWLARGWLTAAKKPVANRDLWEPLVELVRSRGDVGFRWVKGHAGDRMNDLADRLAVEAATTQRGRRGTGPPPDLGEADAPAGGRPARAAPAAGGRPGRGPSLPEGHRVLVTGLRPPGLGGYDDNPVADRVRSRLTEVLEAKSVLHPDLLVLTGLGLGAEQLGAEAALDAAVPFVAVLAHPDPDAVWPEERRRRFRQLLDAAATVVTLAPAAPATRQEAGKAASSRDAWAVRQAAEAVVVWDGDDDRVGRLVRALHVQLGEEQVWVVAP